MELLEHIKHDHSSTSSPPREPRHQVYEYICENLSDVEDITASAALYVPRKGRRTRYAITVVSGQTAHLQKQFQLPLSKLLHYYSTPCKTWSPYQPRTDILSALPTVCIASSLPTLPLPNALVSTLIARSSALISTT